MSSGNKTRPPAVGSARALRCEEARVLLMGYIDDELGPQDIRLLEDHLAVCVECRREEKEFRMLGAVTEDLLNESIGDINLDEAWASVYAGIERSMGWLLLSAGLIVLGGYGIWTLFTEFFVDPDVPLIVRGGVGATLGGFMVLLVSIGREVLFKHKSERYREVKR